MKSKFLTRIIWVFFVVTLVLISACKKDIDETEIEFKNANDYNADVPYEWNELLVEIDRYSPNYRPPAASRNT